MKFPEKPERMWEKIKLCEVCNNRSKKKLFSVRTKL